MGGFCHFLGNRKSQDEFLVLKSENQYHVKHNIGFCFQGIMLETIFVFFCF